MVDKVSAKRVGSSESSPTYLVLWCNGSTEDFGSSSQGSNPCKTTRDNYLLDVAFVRLTRRGTAVDCEVSSSILFVDISRCISIG